MLKLVFSLKKVEQWPDFGCEGIKVQRAHQPTSQCQGKKKIVIKPTFFKLKTNFNIVLSNFFNHRFLTKINYTKEGHTISKYNQSISINNILLSWSGSLFFMITT
eukprot:TRINITY_DN4277_c1_g1_i6.p5 TRINITY_DN4277_c1_g1~~TRINITY_DN4277_c1_g1_i6.p5  ORF type:complete len:105 (+),score=8.67 TRINITY_DN4277_c1_g1_i6:124-438(+)